MNQYPYPFYQGQGVPPQAPAPAYGWQNVPQPAPQPAPQAPQWGAQPQGVPAAPPFGGYPQGGYPAAAPPAGCGQPAPAFSPAFSQPYPQPVYPQPVPVQPIPVAPPFALRQDRNPRLTGASRTLNRMCLVVLLQTAVAFLLEMPLMALFFSQGINIMTDPMAFQWLATAMVPLSTALPFFIYLRLGQKDVTDYLKFEKVGFVTALLCVLSGLALCLLGNFPAFAVQEFFGSFGYEPASSSTGESQSMAMFILEMLSTAVLVPVMEEFAFRGVLLSSLRKYGAGFAIFASAFVFSLVHLDFSNVVFAFIAGLVFGFLYVKTGNLWISIVIHALNNGIAVAGSYGEFLFGEAMAESFNDLSLLIPIAVGLVALILLAIFQREKLFRRSGEKTPLCLSGGEAAAAMVRAPLLWVIVAFMAAYTTTLFF